MAFCTSRKRRDLRVIPISAMAVLLTFGAVWIDAKAQVLAPPLLPGQRELAANLRKAIEEKNLGLYAGLIADDVKVYQDNQLRFSNKGDWLDSFGNMLTAKGVVFKVSSQYAATGRILEIEEFDSAGSWTKGPIGHCCWSHDAVAYEIRANKIVKISKLSGGDTIITPDKP